MRVDGYTVVANERLNGKWLNMTFEQKMNNFLNNKSYFGP